MAESSQASLFGRDVELAMIDRSVESVVQGRGSIVLIQGDPGIGKSSLLNEFVLRARQQGFATSTAFGDPLGARRPLGLLARTLGLSDASPDPTRAKLAHLFLERADRTDPLAEAFTQGPTSLYRIAEETLGLVERLASEQPILIGVDDLQWSDPATLIVIGEMARRLTHLPLLLVLALRPLPNLPELIELLDSLGRLDAVHIKLGPLGPKAIADLAETQLGRRAGKSLRDELAKASGNPFFVKELLRALATDDRLMTSGDSVEVSAAGITPDLQLTLLGRLSILSTEALRLLRAASVLGKRFDGHDVAELVGARPLETDELISEAVTAGILHKDASGELVFVHDLIREAIYQDIPHGLTEALHREAARVMHARGASTSDIAPHLLAGAQTDDSGAAKILIEAGRDAIRRSPAIAIQFFQHGLELLAEADELAGAAAAELAVALHMSGRSEEAYNVASKGLSAGSQLAPDSEGLLYVAQMRSLFTLGRTQASLDVGTQALRKEWPDRVRAMLLVETSQNQSYVGTLNEARRSAESALALLQDDDLRVVRNLALCSLASIEVLEGYLEKGIANAERVIASVTPETSAEAWNAHAVLGLTMLSADRPEDARRLVEEGLQLIESMGGSWLLQMHEWAVAFIDFETGRWDDSLARIEAGFATSPPGFGQVLVLSLMALISLHRGEPDRAAEYVAEGGRVLADSGGSYRADWLLWARALVLEAQGLEEQAQVTLGDAWDACVSMGVISECAILGPDLARLSMIVGDHDRAAEVVKLTEEAAARMGSASARAATLRCLAAATKDAEAALQAVALLRPIGYPLVLALAMEEAAQLGADEALLREAHALYEQIGASSRADKIRPKLKGVTAKRSSVARPSSGWESLTPSELGVVALVAEGLTNRECAARLFVSHRTVETHLKHVFEKLGLRSRVELAAAAARRIHDKGTPLG